MTSFLLHPLTTFLAGAILAILTLGVFLSACSNPNDSAQIVATYQKALADAPNNGPAPGTPAEEQALNTFISFLKNVGNKQYLEENTAKAYAPNAFLDDTLVTHHGPEEIKNYFLQTAETMTSFEVQILDTARSGSDHYIRWRMIFSAPKLAKGTPIDSIGISQVRFNSDGQVAFHQDFWDSGKNIYGNIPFVGGLISTIRNRLK